MSENPECLEDVQVDCTMIDSDLDEDIYEDAHESVSPATEAELLSSLKASRMSLVDYMNDDPEKSLERLEPLRHRNVYCAMCYAGIIAMRALVSFRPEDFESASKTAKECVSVICRRRRGKSIMNNMLMKMVISPNYESYTEEEVHAELCYAECTVIRACLAMMQNRSLVGFLKSGLRIRVAYQCYKNCQRILEHRTWSNVALREEFEAGVDFGIGAFNWIVAGLPPRVLNFLKLIGFSNDRDLAFKHLKNGQKKLHTFCGLLCQFVLLTQSCLARFILGYPKASDSLIEYCERLLKPLLAECPKSLVFHIFIARLQYVRGNVTEALKQHEKIVHDGIYNETKVRHLAVIELGFICMALGDWRRAAYYMDILCHESRWSKTVTYYLKSSALLMCTNLTEEEKQEMVDGMRQVPVHIQRFCGRSVPFEKLCLRRSERFFAQGNWLPLPGLELLYLSNYFYLNKGNSEVLEPILTLVDRAIVDLQDGKHSNSPWHVDNYCLLVFLKGLSLSYLGFPFLAEEHYIEVTQNQKNIVKDEFIVSYAYLELGYQRIESGDFEQAREYFTAARSKSVFMTEFRVHRGFNELKQNNCLYNDKDRIYF